MSEMASRARELLDAFELGAEIDRGFAAGELEAMPIDTWTFPIEGIGFLMDDVANMRIVWCAHPLVVRAVKARMGK
jgi:hypothetical protein